MSKKHLVPIGWQGPSDCSFWYRVCQLGCGGLTVVEASPDRNQPPSMPLWQSPGARTLPAASAHSPHNKSASRWHVNRYARSHMQSQVQKITSGDFQSLYLERLFQRNRHKMRSTIEVRAYNSWKSFKPETA